MAFKYPLKATATLIGSGESGQIIGRAEYTEAKQDYLIRLVAADGRLVEVWWKESAIASVELPPKGEVPAALRKVTEPATTLPTGLPGLPS